MFKLPHFLSRWLPALLMMLVIFYFSAQPSSRLPDFGGVDGMVKKGGHVTGYAILAVLYWRGFVFKQGRQPLAWLLALIYAGTDELHQSLVPGRHPSILDVMIFDNLGALTALWLAGRLGKGQTLRPGSQATGGQKAED
jgi:VanZ family protein